MWTVYLSLLATTISITGLTLIAYREHDHEQPRTLSELAAAQDHLLRRFRIILWVCGTLFAIVMYGYVVPHSTLPPLIFIAWTMVIVGELLVSFLPAREKTRRSHEISAQCMALGMGASAFLFLANLSGVYLAIELGIAFSMGLLAVATFIDPRRFIFYELLFLYLSHTSIVLTTLFLAVR